jgi:hypothetical protein
MSDIETRVAALERQQKADKDREDYWAREAQERAARMACYHVWRRDHMWDERCTKCTAYRRLW